ncbi:MAG TPA: ABC transporter permease [Bryobacteraceae bacterium]|nr:ABC transporter permease [Bryobacteraceae bacterium]
MLRDIRYALRTLAKAPGFTLGAILTLALGIGANTAIFSVIHGVLIRPLPYRDPGRLVRIHETETELPRAPITGPDFLDYRAQSRLFESMASYAPDGASLTGGDRAERVQVTLNTYNLFSLLGVQPFLGRDFRPEDEGWEKHKPVVILSHGLWQRRFGSDRRVLERKIMLNGVPCDVVGVMPKNFRPLWPADLWVADTPPSAENMRSSHDRFAVGRLAPNVTIAQARAEMSAIAKRLERAHPASNKAIGVNLVPLAEDVSGGIRSTLLVLSGAVALVLLIACANVANLLLARGSARREELAIRSALGANRWRIARQLLTESLVLAIAGGACGLLLAAWGIDLIRHSEALGIPRAEEIGVDRTLLAFSALLSIATGILFGIAPAFQLSRSELASELRASGGRTVAGGRSLLRGALVAAEIGLAVVLLAGAGLMVRSFWMLMAVEPGFHGAGVLTAETALPDSRYPKFENRSAFTRSLVERLRAIPGVQTASVTSKLPLNGGNNGTINAEGQPFTQGEMEGPLVEFSNIAPGYFRAMGIPVRAGRDFTERDFSARPNTVIVNQTLAARFFPNQNPLGKHITRNRNPPEWLEIVGVVGDTRQWGLAQPAIPELYHPFVTERVILVVRGTLPPERLAEAVRREVAAADKDLPLYSVRTMEEIIDDSAAWTRSRTTLLSLFAAVALALAAIGIYGLVSFSMTQRRHEIGIRIALGATRGDVLRLALAGSARLVAAGLAAGLACTFAFTRYLSSMLYGVKPVDPLTFVAVPLFLAAVAFAASLVPALRATSLRPAAALRHE